MWILFPEISLSKWKVSKTSRGGGLCAVSLVGIDQFKKLGVTCCQKDRGSKFLLPEGFRSFSRSGLVEGGVGVWWWWVVVVNGDCGGWYWWWPPSLLWKRRGLYLVRRVVPHIRCERGWVSCHSSGSLEGGCPSSAEVIKDTEDCIQLQRLL